MKLKRSENVVVRFCEDDNYLIENEVAGTSVVAGPRVLFLLRQMDDYREVADILGGLGPGRPVAEQVRETLGLLEGEKILVGETLGEEALIESDYAKVLVHVAMIKDFVRSTAYQHALRCCVKPGDSVIDLGCGSGLLALFAVQAGAARVFAIEQTKIIRLAQELARANGAESKIHFLFSNSKDVALGEKVDVIVSELLGNDPLDENLLDYTLDARDRLLKAGGILMPHKIQIYMVGLDSKFTAAKNSIQARQLADLGHLYGLEFGPLIRAVENCTTRNYVRDLELTAGGQVLLTQPTLVQELDLMSISAKEFETAAEITVTQDGTLNEFCLFFRAWLTDQIFITNSPWSPKTHWGQSFIRPEASRVVRKGEVIRLALSFTGRRLMVALAWGRD